MAKTDREGKRDDGRDAMAAEYVLGTLDAAERATAEDLIATDADFASAVADWQARLAELDDAAPEVTPPEGARARIIAAANASAETDPPDTEFQIALLKKQLRFWQGTAVAGAAIAACLLLLPILPVTEPPLENGQFVAVLQSGESAPAFVAAVDLARGTISIRHVGSDAPPSGHDYELWVVGGSREAPESLGVVHDVVRMPVAALGSELHDTVLAVSVEPTGGSPTGMPTGPVLFSGHLIAAQ